MYIRRLFVYIYMYLHPRHIASKIYNRWKSTPLPLPSSLLPPLPSAPPYPHSTSHSPFTVLAPLALLTSSISLYPVIHRSAFSILYISALFFNCHVRLLVGVSQFAKKKSGSYTSAAPIGSLVISNITYYINYLWIDHTLLRPILVTQSHMS